MGIKVNLNLEKRMSQKTSFELMKSLTQTALLHSEKETRKNAIKDLLKISPHEITRGYEEYGQLILGIQVKNCELDFYVCNVPKEYLKLQRKPKNFIILNNINTIYNF